MGGRTGPNINVSICNITQFFTEYDNYYSQYLHQFGLDDSPSCRVYGTPEGAERVVFYCPRFVMRTAVSFKYDDSEPKTSFTMERRIERQALGKSVIPENIIAEIVNIKLYYKL